VTDETLHESFHNVERIYQISGQVQRLRYQAEHPLLMQFHRDVRRLCGQVEQAEEEQHCGPLLRRLRRFSFLSASTPLPFDHPLLWPDQAAEIMAEALKLYPNLFPTFLEVLRRIESSLTQLRANPSNPLWTWLTDNVPRRVTAAFWQSSRSDRTLMLADSRILQAVETLVESANLDLRLGTSLDFHKEQTVSAQIFLGSSRWFPAWCFTAPRSPKIELLQFRWVWDQTEYPATFQFNKMQSQSLKFIDVREERKTHLDQSQEDSPVTSTDIGPQAEELEQIKIDSPIFDWSRLLKREHFDERDADADEVLARCYGLQGYIGIWLPLGDDETVLGLQLDESNQYRVDRLPVDELRPDDYLLLRTGEAGDLLTALADNILGSGRDHVHRVHAEWKRVFRQKIFTNESAISRLKKLGAVKATPSNIRNWQSEGNLRPQRNEDFRAIVEFCGMEARFDEIANAVKLLRTAQQSAGQRIGHMILNTIRGTDLTALQREGKQTFTLAESQDGGSFTAYRLVSIAEQEAWIAPSRLAKPFVLEEELE
jgi:hypothetical protein